MVETPAAAPARRINWSHAITVVCAAVLIGTEVFVAAVAGGWALAGLLGLGDIGAFIFEGLGLALAAATLWFFLKAATRVEPIFESS